MRLEVLEQGWTIPEESHRQKNHPLIEFNDVGDGSGLPQDVLWAIARNKLQIGFVQLPGEGRFYHSSPFSADAPILHDDVSHQDRTLDRQDREHLFTGLGDRLESLSEGLRGEDEARAEYYLALAGRFRGVALSRPTWVL